MTKIQKEVYYYPLKMKDGWHIWRRTEYKPRVEYKDWRVVKDGETARALSATLNTGRNYAGTDKE